MFDVQADSKASADSKYRYSEVKVGGYDEYLLLVSTLIVWESFDNHLIKAFIFFSIID